MVLSAHAITGAAVASAFPAHPVAGFCLGFASHFVLDTIPHWDYKLASLVENKNDPMDADMIFGKDFIFDLFKIGADFFIGLVLVYLLFGLFHPFSFIITLYAGAFGATLPDAFHFVYFKWKRRPFKGLEKFHLKIQTHLKNNRALEFMFEITAVAIVILIQKLAVSP